MVLDGQETDDRDEHQDEPPRAKRKVLPRAAVWSHFIRQSVDRSVCKYCGIEVSSNSKTVGTSPMISHIKRCKMFKTFNDKDKQSVLGGDRNGEMQSIHYDPSVFRKSVIEMVVVNELPFSFVESEGFKRFCNNVVPLCKLFSRRTASREVVATYKAEKAALSRIFCGEKKRVSVTTDIWVAPTTSYNYMVVTAHWIDDAWKLQKRIISFKPITDHKGETIARHLIECLEDWGIERVFTITVDNARGNDKALRVFCNDFGMKGPEALVLGGAYLHMRCCAHILNLVVRDGLARVSDSVVAIRNAVKYVRSSYTRLKSFELRCETGKVSRGSLALDCVTRWNSTYLMLSSAIKLRVAFDKMLAEDKLYCEYFDEEEERGKKRVGPPLAADWDEVEVLVKFLKMFFKCTLTFSSSKTVTSTLCYNEIVTIERNLISRSSNIDRNIRDQANSMRDKFDKYWDGLLNMNPLVIIASVFDPRNKMQFATLCFETLYGKDSVECVQLHSLVGNAMKSLYEEYSLRLVGVGSGRRIETGGGSSNRTEAFETADLSDDDEDYESMDSVYTQLVSERRNEDLVTELEIYLMEKTETKLHNALGLHYNVLDWWMRNSVKFPILSELAKDVLAIQVSSVASESAFSTSGKILDPYRSSLTPYMIEALICTQQWLRCNIEQAADQVPTLVQMLEEVDFYDSLDPRNEEAPAQSQPTG